MDAGSGRPRRTHRSPTNGLPTAALGRIVDGQDRSVRVVSRDAPVDVATGAREEPVLLGVEAGGLAHLGRLGCAAGPVRMYRAAAIAPASAAFCSARRIVSANPRSITSAAISRSVTMPPAKMTRTWPVLAVASDSSGHPYC